MIKQLEDLRCYQCEKPFSIFEQGEVKTRDRLPFCSYECWGEYKFDNGQFGMGA